MPPLVISDTIQCRLTWDLDGVPWAQNVLHFRPSTPGQTVVQATATAVANDISADFTSSGMKAQQADNWRLSSVGLRDLRTPNNPEYIQAVNNPGTGTAHVLPRGVAAVVTLRTAMAGPSYRGRIYFGGWTEAGSSALGTIEDAVATTAVAFTNLLLNVDGGIVGQPLRLSVASRTLGISNFVTSVVMRDRVWDSQRRRRDGLLGS